MRGTVYGYCTDVCTMYISRNVGNPGSVYIFAEAEALHMLITNTQDRHLWQKLHWTLLQIWGTCQDTLEDWSRLSTPNYPDTARQSFKPFHFYRH